MGLFSDIGNVVSSLRSGVGSITKTITSGISTVRNVVQPVQNLANTIRTDVNTLKGVVRTVQSLNPATLYKKVTNSGDPLTNISNILNVTNGALNNLNGAVNRIDRVVNSTSNAIESLPGFTTVFQTDSGISTSTFNGSPFASGASYGYVNDIGGWVVPDNQLVTITATSETNNSGTIKAIINKPFTFSTTSEWESFFAPSPDILNLALQAFTKKSAVNPYSSRRIWKGTSPLRLTIELYFYAIEDPITEVFGPCIKLQRLCLPTYTGATGFLGIPLLTPPGPSPFSFNVKDGEATSGDIINIQIGNMITFQSVIVKEVSVQYDNKFDQNGYPLSAVASVQFETFQATTKEVLSKYIHGALPYTETLSAAQQSPSATAAVPQQSKGNTVNLATSVASNV